MLFTDSFETNTYTQKEGYIASKNGIHIFNCHGTVIDMCTIDCPYKACFQCQKKVSVIFINIIMIVKLFEKFKVIRFVYILIL